MKLTTELSKQEISAICKMVSLCVKSIFIKCGYKDYDTDLWIIKVNQ